MVPRFSVVPAAYVFFLREPPSSPGTTGPDRREVLLQLRRNTGYMDGHWAAAAAGHVESGESVFDAARREATEEVGVTDVELDPLCAMHRTGNTGDPVDERVDYFFSTSRWSGEPRIIEPDKCAELRWFGLGDLPEPVVPHELEVLEAVRAGHVDPIVAHGF